MGWYDELQPSSFDGLRFLVEGTVIESGFAASTEVQIGRGHVARPAAPGQKLYRFDAFLNGERVIAAAKELTARFDAGPGLLVHPHFGATDALCSRWSVDFEGGGRINFARITLEFKSTTLDADVDAVAPVVRTDLESVQSAAVEQSAGFADELEPAAELAAVAPVLDLDQPEPSEPVTPEYTQAATSRLLRQGQPNVSGVPTVLGQLGAAQRKADAGQLDAGEADAVAAALLRQAARVNSLTLLRLRESWLLFVRELGAGAVAQVVEGRGRSLPAISVNAGVDLGSLVNRNRAAVVNWFARSEVSL